MGKELTSTDEMTGKTIGSILFTERKQSLLIRFTDKSFIILAMDFAWECQDSEIRVTSSDKYHFRKDGKFE